MKPQGTKQLHTDRLILRPFTADDAVDMFENWASDPEVTRYLTWPTHTSVESSRYVLNMWLPEYADPNRYNWAIEYKPTGRVIGNISVVRLNDKVDGAEIGYCLGRAFWGQGIMPEALRAVIDFLFAEVELWRIAACHDANNPNSGRVMDKAGMRVEGVWRQAGRNNQGVCDEVWHSVLRREWEKGR